MSDLMHRKKSKFNYKHISQPDIVAKLPKIVYTTEPFIPFRIFNVDKKKQLFVDHVTLYRRK